MTPRYAYDERRQPAAPRLPVRVGVPGRTPEVLLAALVDTGADITVVPRAVVRQLRLPSINLIGVRGVGGELLQAVVYAAEFETDWTRFTAEVVGLGDEMLLGRDALNLWTLILEGPARKLEVAGRTRTPR